MLTWQHYDNAMDIWSIGCIFAEMITGTILFAGEDRMLLLIN
jgi:p38 MAP kinase